MDKNYFLTLLRRYREGIATAEEERFIKAYYNIFESEPDVLDMLTDAENQRLKSQLQAGIWEQIAGEESLKVIRPRKRLTWLKAAAAVLIIAGATLAAILFMQKDPQPAQPLTRQQVNPERENNLVQLPDGSTVIVSPGSRLLYPSSFDGQQKREVYLEGKAFFDIRHHSSKIFVVHTGRLKTIVLGTSFEIKAMKDAADITVTVATGKVKVEKDDQPLGTIAKDEQLVIKTDGKITAPVKTDATAQTAWKLDDMLFDDVTLGNAAAILEDRFHITIVIKDEQLANQRFSTTFGKEEKLEQLLESICTFNRAAYQYDKEKNTVYINRKTTQPK